MQPQVLISALIIIFLPICRWIESHQFPLWEMNSFENKYKLKWLHTSNFTFNHFHIEIVGCNGYFLRSKIFYNHHFRVQGTSFLVLSIFFRPTHLDQQLILLAKYTLQFHLHHFSLLSRPFEYCLLLWDFMFFLVKCKL